ncbi:MAG: xanthine dehydrogenase family protein molybdopterin-binding subunit [Burkholderiales bacterium]|nr:MAG: xanthine dehydrogenase family protein molybdopterin-binding subunit [Burkholderiales bacterium]
MTADSHYGRFGSGHAVRRIEDPTLVSGTGVFVDDVSAPGQLHACFVRTPIAHARLKSIDTEQALAMPGVIAIYTGADLLDAGVDKLPGPDAFKRADGSPAATPPRRALAVETVRFVGEAVAVVVAESLDAARAARDAVLVDYEELPAVASIAAATAEGAPLVWPDAPGNVCAQLRHGDAAAADKAFAEAAEVVTLELVNQRLAACPMEPRALLATYEAEQDRLTLRMTSQMPGGARGTVAKVLGMPVEKVRVLVGDVGGGFGMKTGLYPEDATIAYCARTLKRPVKWCSERTEEFLATAHGRDIVSRASLALDAEGRVLAMRIRSLANVGAYASSTGVAIQLRIGPWVATSIYDIPVIDFDFTAILTNVVTTGAYRGAGRPEAIYICERLMDAAARRLRMDPAQLRARNMIRPEQMPYRNAMGQTYDSGNFASIQAQALQLADWDGFEARAAESAARGKLRGRGIASFLEWTGGNQFEERVTVTVSADGFIEIFSATQAMGQGIATTYAQLAVDVFGVPIDRIRIVQGDTDRGVGFGSAGSRSLFTGGSAVKVASGRTVDRARELASEELEVDASDLEYVEGSFRIIGTDRSIDLFELAGRQDQRRIHIDSTSSVDAASWPNGCHICEVEIDPDTGTVEVLEYASVNDVGRAVNPMIVRGQLDGGAVQGIGQALTEQVIYEADSGQLVTASFLDYALPRAGIVRRFRTELDQSIPCKTNPLGVKGVGELGTIGATPAVVNAVVDALDRAGLGERAQEIQMPLTPERIWSALQARASG